MSDIQRYDIDSHTEHPTGYWVTYADHLAALHACEERIMETALAPWEGQQRYLDGFAAALDAARDAVVAALGPMDCTDPDQYRKALAAIKKLRKGAK